MTTCAAHSDKDLLRLIQQDNIAAFTELYNRYWKKLHASVYAVLRNREAAGDIVQEIFISLWERRLSLEVEYVSAYLYQAARFQVFKAIRNEKMDAGFQQRLVEISTAVVTGDPVLFNELKDLLNKGLERLPEDQRKAFLLSRNEGLSYKEIAAHMNISPKTIEKKMSQALKQLRLNVDKAFLLLGFLLFLRS